jgi:putative transposase
VADEALAQELVARARSEGVELVGPGGLLTGLTKTVLETALEVELEDHLGYPKHAVEGRDKGNSRNGSRSKTLLTEVGEVENRFSLQARRFARPHRLYAPHRRSVR